MAIILGIDPGSRITGFGVIEFAAGKARYIASGCIKANPAEAEAERLRIIYQGVCDVIAEYQPIQGAIEQVFMFYSAGSALKLGQARGAAQVAMATHGLPVSTYSAKQVKQSVVGYGGASKEQVQMMVTDILSLTQQPPEDAADALAIALCHAHTQESLQRLGPAKKIVAGRLR